MCQYPKVSLSADFTISFSEKTIAKALSNIYKKRFDIKHEVEPELFSETVRIFNLATATGITDAVDSGTDMPSEAFMSALKSNNDVFAAFRTHRMQTDIAAKMVDEKGSLKSFSRFARDVKPYTDHQNRAWLQTEYSTAVMRAHRAADWQQFEAEKDVLPNLEWMPSTSPNPGADHRAFWATVLPIDHPFWNEHKPGDRWNCKCRLRNTDKEPTAVPTGGENDQPARGLENNPGKDAKLFSDKHSYFPSSCGTCPFADNKLAALFVGLAGKKKNCYECGKVDNEIGRIIDSVRNATIAKDKALTISSIKEFKKAMPIHDGVSIKSRRFETGKMTVLRRSLDDIFEHAIEEEDVRKWLQLYNISSLKAIRYKGWAPNRPYKQGHPKYDPNNPAKSKHDNDTYWFNYYTININKRTYWVNVKMHKVYGEVVYTMEKEKPDDLIKGHKKK